MKTIYAITNKATGILHGDAFTSKMEAIRFVSALNREEKRARTGKQWAYAEVHPELAGGLNLNPYSV